MLKNFEKSKTIFGSDFQKSSELSQEIKILAEVEKIWILYDADDNGCLITTELQEYLNEVAFPQITISDDEINELF